MNAAPRPASEEINRRPVLRTTSPHDGGDPDELSATAEGRYRTPPGKRNIRVVVTEEVFVDLHDAAVQSRMRIQPFLRRILAEAKPFPVLASNLALTFASGDPVPEPDDEDVEQS